MFCCSIFQLNSTFLHIPIKYLEHFLSWGHVIFTRDALFRGRYKSAGDAQSNCLSWFVSLHGVATSSTDVSANLA